MNFKKILTEGLDDMMDGIKNLKPSESGQNPATSGQVTPATVTPTPTTPQSNIKVARYKNSRNFGVWWGEELIVVAVYLKGANRVAELLKQLEAKK